MNTTNTHTIGYHNHDNRSEWTKIKIHEKNLTYKRKRTSSFFPPSTNHTQLFTIYFTPDGIQTWLPTFRQPRVFLFQSAIKHEPNT